MNNDDHPNTKLDKMKRAVRNRASDITVGGRKPRFSVVCTSQPRPNSGLFEIRQRCGNGTNRLASAHAQIECDGSVTVEWRS
jgi:hypothetical protein